MHPEARSDYLQDIRELSTNLFANVLRQYLTSTSKNTIYSNLRPKIPLRPSINPRWQHDTGAILPEVT